MNGARSIGCHFESRFSLSAAARPPGTCVAAAVILLVASLFAPVFSANAQVVPGNRLPPVSLKSYDDKEYSIDRIRRGSKGVVIVFLANTCPAFLRCVDRLNAVEKEYRGKGVLFVGVALNGKETAEQLKAALHINNMSYLVLRDEKGSVRRTFGVRRIPEVFVFDSAATCVYRGLIDDKPGGGIVKRSYLREALDAVLNQTRVKTARTRSDGCPVK